MTFGLNIKKDDNNSKISSEEIGIENEENN